jgi:hypothetical protein
MRTVEVVRCRYCVDHQGFVRMIRHVDGKFICDGCGHIERPADPDFLCNCGRCMELSVFRYRSHAVSSS